MATTIDLARLRRLIDDGAQFVEVLPADAYEDEHLPGAVNIPLKRLTPNAAARLERTSPVVAYCYDRL